MTSRDLVRAATAADIVVLGEQHDNADHHRIQADLLRGIVASGRRPAALFEQIDFEAEASLDRALAASRGKSPTERADAVAAAVGWPKSGWPSFDIYRPVFEAALAADLPIRAANLSRAAMHANVSRDDVPVVALADAARASMAAEVEESHCGYANEKMTTMMIDMQRRRDARMARAVVAALDETATAATGNGRARAGAVLVCGFAHARTDSGVPLTLRRDAPAGRIVSIGIVEVIPGMDEPQDYASAFHASALPFDYVVFTPRVDDEDPCEKYRKALEKIGRP